MMLFQTYVCQWTYIAKYYYQDIKFQNQTNVGGFNIPQQSKSAYYIDCDSPSTSQITLTSELPRLISEDQLNLNSGDYVSLDLFFSGIWNNDIFKIIIGGQVISLNYTKPDQYPISSGFCDNIQADAKSLNFKIQTTQQVNLEFQIQNSNVDGQVSIKNLFISRLLCHPLCISCTGQESTQCTSCYSGTPNNNRCPLCPSNQSLMPDIGCTVMCDFYQRETYEKICVYFKSSTLYQETLYPNEKRYQVIQTSLIGLSQYMLASTSQDHGIFTLNSGTIKFIDLSSFNQGYFLIGLKLVISLYDPIPIDTRIEFHINNTYYGSIYQTDQGMQLHRIQLYKTEDLTCVSLWTNCKTITLFMFVDIPNYSFAFKAIGYYQTSGAGWSIKQIEVSSGKCQENCQYCELAYLCKICNVGLYVSSDGNCVKCEETYQIINEGSCIDYGQEAPYSGYLIQNEKFELTNDPSQTTKYLLASAEGFNFLKGSNIWYSFWHEKFIFGGQYVWSQAKFKIIHQSLSPHYSVTIGFYILYGPNFPEDGQFIYTFENDQPITKSAQSANLSFADATLSERVKTIHPHSSDTLTLYWECKGSNNNIYDAYCGLYGYNVVVHYCQPYCLECSSEKVCTKWDNSVDAKFHSVIGCQPKTYYNKQEQKCLPCPNRCKTCTSEMHCQSCELTYTLTKSGCKCLMTQYYADNQCYECPIGCNQCLNNQACVECLTANNRELKNGKCECLDGYYSISSNPVCQKCHSQSICQCPSGTSYDASSKSCKTCHSSCQTCFNLTQDGCLTCDITKNKYLKGLKCVCRAGYYEQNNICLSCPEVEDQQKVQCYKFCQENYMIWHTQNCLICKSGFQLIDGECTPICGDHIVVGYEQCEDGNNDIDDLCFNCQFQCPSDCQTCNSNTMLPCSGYCGDGIVNGTEECDDGNQIQYDGCHNCKFQCFSKCTNCVKGKCTQCVTKTHNHSFAMSSENCFLQCGSGNVIVSDQCIDYKSITNDECQICRFKCRSNCINCEQTTGRCLDCNVGFKPNSSFCENICGDILVAQDSTNFYTEACDDGNIINRDLCSSQCKRECQIEEVCTDCRNTLCYACGYGYYLNENHYCYSICGDLKKAKDEECDEEKPYKCLNCLAKCQESCLQCSTQGKGCLQCKEGYRNIDNMCETICGDGYVTADEQCDDGNFIFEDGCHQCLKVCTIGCSACIDGSCTDCHEGYQYFKQQCIKIDENFHDPRCNSDCLECSIERHGCLKCQSGYNNIDNRCYSICGDQNKLDIEKCDDGNFIFEDNCHQCDFNCPISCSNCIEGVCIRCYEEFFLYKKRCFSKIENDPLASLTNFQYSNLKSLQSFSSTLFSSYQFQVETPDLNQQKYNQKDYHPIVVSEITNSIRFTVDLQCSKNQKLDIQFNTFEHTEGFDKESLIFQGECHNTFYHSIRVSFILNKVITKNEDEILVIIIKDNELKFALINGDFLQNLLSFKFVNV
ncbi:unnamed protein product (macronuclear) [Paramecium tetraurelia]|uniref:EGF-like domain-containing protein n=1 Tax=Paramecium tetraurelia TaxID=5888 RepID=A0BXL8_PARTE|nr:uncharacterized protein GSPATT00033138001 [Paramecium tetraurelia]CAK63285.1 unnamed protein product [Paramecium tetraurelia]|eukprot:XP_001430683.1 hypothetical protein (macronuclear) [Paramecium tetraurelia strain d4-2]